LRIEMLGRMRRLRAAWQLTMSDGKMPHGLFTLVFRRFPEGWKIVHDHTRRRNELALASLCSNLDSGASGSLPFVSSTTPLRIVPSSSCGMDLSLLKHERAGRLRPHVPYRRRQSRAWAPGPHFAPCLCPWLIGQAVGFGVVFAKGVADGEHSSWAINSLARPWRSCSVGF